VAQVDLKVFLKAVGIKPTTKDLKALNAQMGITEKKTRAVSKSAGELDRNIKGTAQITSNTTKAFAKQSQGMGGLIQSYAIVAAHVFALSAAFLVLRRTADLSSMIKSAENFSTRFGVSVTRITKQMQEASGGALSFAEALPIINKAVSAGVPIEKMEALTKAATKAAQTFGGSATEALNRFISASQRGRVEIIQTLGVVIKTEDAYKRYAAQIGKTALELSAFDRQQAILNATIEASQSVFDGVKIDPNPFQQLLTTIIDLKDSFGVLLTDFLTPMIDLFNKSKLAAAGFIGVIIQIVSSQLFSGAGQFFKGVAASGQKATREVRALGKASEEVAKKRAAANKLVATGSTKSLKREVSTFENAQRKKVNAHADFVKKILTQEGKLNKGVLSGRTLALQANIANLKKGGKGVKGLGSIESSQRQLAVLKELALREKIVGTSAVAKGFDRQAAAAKRLTGTLAVLSAKHGTLNISVKKVTSDIKTGFAQGFQIAEGRVRKSMRGMLVGWKKFGRGMTQGTQGINTNLSNLGKAVGRTGGIIAGIGSKILSNLGLYIFAFTILKSAYTFLVDALNKVTPEQKLINDATEDFKEGMEAANVTLAKGIELWGDKAPSSLKEFGDSFTFIGGIFESVANEVNRFSQKSVKALDGLTVDGALKELNKLNARSQELRASPKQEFALGLPEEGTTTTISLEARRELTQTTLAAEKLNSTLIGIGQADILSSLINQFKSATGFAEDLGIVYTEVFLESAKVFSGLNSEIGVFNALQLRGLAVAGDWDALRSRVSELKEEFKDNGAALVLLNTLTIKFFSSASGEITSLSRSAANSLKQLQEVSVNFNTFQLGLEKLKSQKSPFKEVFGFAISAERALRDLIEVQNVAPSKTLEEAFATGEISKDLEGIAALLGSGKLTLKEAVAEAERQRKIFQEQLEFQLLGTKRLKVLSTDLATLKLKEIKSDEARLSIITAIESKEKDINTQKLAQAVSNRNAAQTIVDSSSKANLADAEATLAVFEAEVRSLIERGRVLAASTKREQERLKIVREVISNDQAILAARKSVSNINKKLVTSTVAFLAESKKIFLLDKQRLANSVKDIEARKEQILIEQDAGPSRERALALEEEKLLVLEAQSRELERQQMSRRAREDEQIGGLTVFSEEGIGKTVDFFIIAMQQGVNKLKSTFEILGKGFADTINATFDKAVDNLLEGGHDFGRAVIETLKEGLRETFGEALKSRIRDSLNTIFSSGRGDESLNKQLQASEQLTSTTKLNTFALNKLTTELKGNSVLPSGVKPVEQAKDSIIAPLSDVLSDKLNFGKTEDTLASIQGVLGESKDITKQGFLDNIKTLGLLLFEMIKQGAKAIAGGIGSLFGFGTGGIASGGFSSIPKLAAGAIATGPNLALIGEGSRNEAVVPLPNNREIPVDLKGAVGDTVNIEQNFDFRGASTDAIPLLRQEARAIEDRTFARVFSEINRGGRAAQITGRR